MSSIFLKLISRPSCDVSTIVERVTRLTVLKIQYDYTVDTSTSRRTIEFLIIHRIPFPFLPQLSLLASGLRNIPIVSH